MFSLFFEALVQSIVFPVLAFAGLILALRVFDKICGFNFGEWLRNDETSSLAKAVYFGSRIIAGAIVIAATVSLPF